MYRCSICPTITQPRQLRLQYRGWGVCPECHADLQRGVPLGTLVRERSRPVVIDKTPAGQSAEEVKAERFARAYGKVNPIQPKTETVTTQVYPPPQPAAPVALGGKVGQSRPLFRNPPLLKKRSQK